ncbi:MAG TPA: CRTAC1 family protein [Pirellulaceae bacterium]|nr:CRTAC1 family protein [Pirellulaceae bacterium]
MSDSAETVAPSTPEVVQRNAAIPSRRVNGLSTRELHQNDWFEEIGDTVGVDFIYSDGGSAGFYQLLESVGGGVAAIDFDLDGWQDLFLTGGGTIDLGDGQLRASGCASGLFHNRSGSQFVDVGQKACLLDDSLYTHGCTVADLDADGFPDVLVAGYQGLRAWMNQGDGTFAERAAQLGFDSPNWNVVPAAADYDNDGLVDVYIVTYADWLLTLEERCINDRQLRDICGPTLFAGQRDQLFRNTGERFENVTDEVQLVQANRGLGIVAVDIDGNGRIDFAVVNDVQENQCYLNMPDGSFREQGVLAGMAYSSTGEREGSMGIDVGDFNRDGWPDLWYTNYANQDNSLMININGTGFIHASDAVGMGGVSRRWVGFGTTVADFNGDGWEDIFVANGHVAYERLDSPYYQPAQLFESRGGERFVEVSERGGPYFALPRAGRGAAVVDFDNDGNLDLVVVHQNEPAAILRNRNVCTSWLRLGLVGTSSERSGVGAKVTVSQGSRSVTSWRIGGGSYLSHNDSRLLFGLDSDTATMVTVTWPGGQVEHYADLAPNHTHTLVQDRGSYVAP